MSPRPRTADVCNALHELELGGQPVTYRCGRQLGHAGYHQCKAITWGRLWDRPLRPRPPRPAPAPPPREPSA